ncbi:hypothetical protein ES703_101355 [subsurface metagenome]
MRGEQEFVLRFSPMQIFTVGELAVGEAGVDQDLIGLIRQCLELPMRHAEGPVLGVV